MLTDPQYLQDMANRDFRDLASEEFDTRTLLRNAVDQAIARKYEDFLIVDTDSHHYETEAFKEIAEYIDDEEILIVALDRLVDGIAQQRAGVEFLAGEVANRLDLFVHGVVPQTAT